MKDWKESKLLLQKLQVWLSVFASKHLGALGLHHLLTKSKQCVQQTGNQLRTFTWLEALLKPQDFLLVLCPLLGRHIPGWNEDHVVHVSPWRVRECTASCRDQDALTFVSQCRTWWCRRWYQQSYTQDTGVRCSAVYMQSSTSIPKMMRRRSMGITPCRCHEAITTTPLRTLPKLRTLNPAEHQVSSREPVASLGTTFEFTNSSPVSSIGTSFFIFNFFTRNVLQSEFWNFELMRELSNCLSFSPPTISSAMCSSCMIHRAALLAKGLGYWFRSES